MAAVTPFPWTDLLIIAGLIFLNGLFAILAALGGVMYVVIVVSSVFFGKKLAPDERPTYPEVPPQAIAVSEYGNAESLKIPGTAMMVAVFFIAQQMLDPEFRS